MEITPTTHTGPERTIIVLGAQDPDNGWLFLAADGETITDAPERAQRFESADDAKDAKSTRMGAMWQARTVVFCTAFEVF